MGPRCSSAETQVCHRSYIIAAIYKYTYNFIFERSLLYAYQSGFIRGHSTVYQLLEMYHT
jgi:hypothetical protein